MRRPVGVAAALVLAAATLAGARAGAQCDVPDAGDPSDDGTLRDTFPGDQGVDVPTDSPVRLRFIGHVPPGPTLCVERVDTPGCIAGNLAVDGDEYVWTNLPGAVFAPYINYRVTYTDALATTITLSFRSGRGPSAGAPHFAGITQASSNNVDGDPCDPAAADITVRFNRVVFDATLGTPWAESDVEYVIYETRGPGISGPRERDRARLQSSGSTADNGAQRTFRLSSADASGPVCFSVQALDPLGRVATNGAEECVNPSQGNYFAGCTAAPRRGGNAVAWALLGGWALLAARRRQRALVSASRSTVGSAGS